jgi:hypothetical protein
LSDEVEELGDDDDEETEDEEVRLKVPDEGELFTNLSLLSLC